MENKPTNSNEKVSIVSVVVITILALILVGAIKLPESITGAKNSTSTDATISTTSGQLSQDSVSAAPAPPLSLSDVAKDWRKSTAYVICFWEYSNGQQYKVVSGSGLLATFNSASTIITNKHVVVDPLYGAANECDVRFPDDNGYYFYSKNNPNSYGGYYPSEGNVTVDSNDYDVAYITGIDSTWTSLPVGTSPTISLDNRSRNNPFACTSSLSTGDPVVILGYPAIGTKMGSVLNSPAEPTVTEGIISGKDGFYYTTSAKIDHGNSGGLAIDKNNNCYFGIPTWAESGGFESLGRILPTSMFIQ